VYSVSDIILPEYKKRGGKREVSIPMPILAVKRYASTPTSEERAMVRSNAARYCRNGL